eukprot:366452-Chlamydomonas_euryale.AAC.9
MVGHTMRVDHSAACLCDMFGRVRCYAHGVHAPSGQRDAQCDMRHVAPPNERSIQTNKAPPVHIRHPNAHNTPECT